MVRRQHCTDRPRVLRLLALSALSSCVVFASWLHYVRVEDQRARSFHELRQSTVQHQHAEQRLARLNDGVSSPLLHVLGEDISAVQIRLADYLTGLQLDPQENPLNYKQALLTHQLSTNTVENISDSTVKSVRILRLDVQLPLAHAPEFLVRLRDIYFEVGGWPVEVRACDLHKTPSKILDARCILDIYYWSASVDESHG